jgi:drug/metabolite transporter (DMT)-like permease
VHEILILAVKGLAGGGLVVAFALLSEGLAPKRFAGLFSAAPAVALAGLTVVLLDKGAHEAHQNAAGMIAGGLGMVAYAVAAVPLLRRKTASIAAVLALSAWFAVAALASLPLLVG